MTTTCAYYRTSSATNVGPEKDSLRRQQDAVSACANARGLTIVHEYYDAAVSGADPVDTRAGFNDMIAYMLGNGARTIIVENASRFARDLIVQETGYQMLKARGIELIAADSPESFLSDTPTAALIRQILGAVAQFEKTTLVNKLRGARDRKSAKLGHRCEGNPAFGRIPASHTAFAQHLRGQGISLRAIAVHMAAEGFVARTGEPYAASTVRKMLRR